MKSLLNCTSAIIFASVTLFTGCGRQEISTHTSRPPGEEIAILPEDIETTMQHSEVQKNVETTTTVQPEKASEKLMLSDDTGVQCPIGSTFVTATRLCVTKDNHVIGPFTKTMISDCVKYGGGKACKSAEWDYDFAVSLRGNKVCPKGSTLSAELNVCIEGSDAIGPFTKIMIARCQENKGGAACATSLQFAASLLKATILQPTQGTANRKLFDYYSQNTNYNKVFNNVMSWYGTTSNGCVAFMSSALRLIGIAVPQNGSIGGDPVSLVTLPFSRYLKEKLGWVKITRAADLLPGDVVFTIDAPGWPGYPAHTYMFHSWVDKPNGTGRVVDNQAFTHNRNIFGYGSYNFSPFVYALRSPN